MGNNTEPQSSVPKQKANPTPGHIGIRPQQLTGTSSFLATNTMWEAIMICPAMLPGFMSGVVADISM